ncbi:MAG: hypothetical protein AAB372_00575 [Patescibacteria group bacterium]
MRRFFRALLFAVVAAIPVAFFMTLILGVATLVLDGNVFNERWLEPELIGNEAYGVHLSGYDLILLFVVSVSVLLVFFGHIRSENKDRV